MNQATGHYHGLVPLTVLETYNRKETDGLGHVSTVKRNKKIGRTKKRVSILALNISQL